MQITVKGKQIDLTDSLKNYASEKMGKMSRYFDHMISAEVCLSIERNWHVAEITVFGEGFDMRGEEKSTDMYNSIDRVIEKLERQLKKQKGKLERRKSARGPAAPVVSALPETRESSQKPKKGQPTMEDESLYAPRVEKVQTFYAQSLTIEMAIKEMESAGHDFYAFYNQERRRINIVYKKKKGYGLIDPRLED